MNDSRTNDTIEMKASGLKQNLLWLGAGLLAVGVLSVTASYAPAIMKRLIIFHAVYGIACGVVLIWLASEIHPTWNRWLPLWGSGLCLLGVINMGWLSYQHFHQVRAEYAAAHPKEAALQTMLEKISKNDPQMRARYLEEKSRLQPEFQDYLKHRVKNFGDWVSPWPEVFWGAEMLLAAILCGVTIYQRRSARRFVTSKE